MHFLCSLSILLVPKLRFRVLRLVLVVKAGLYLGEAGRVLYVPALCSFCM